MARKFLYFVAAVVILVIAALLALRLWSDGLSRVAFVPDGTFERQSAMAETAYAKADMWIARPDLGKADAARWMPEGFPGEDAHGSNAAVFFVHPTSYLAKSHWNAPLDNKESRDLAETLVKILTSPFNRSPSVWAPRYRQATFGAFLSDAPEATQSLDLAYGDVLQAFDHFIASVPADAPIVLAGHSQGSFHLRRLIRDRIAGKPLARRIIAAYLVGWPVSLEHDLPAMGLPACQDPVQTGCVISWLSFAEPADPGMMAKAYERRPGMDGKSLVASPFLCSNPLTGKPGSSADAALNPGTLVPNLTAKTGKLEPRMVPASCRADGFLSIGAPPKLGPFVLPGNNYHVYDIPMFWMSLRADFDRRNQAWNSPH